ncbi:MAG: phosphatase PAP2 family protein [Haloferacaceae archaeon]
MTRGLGLVGTAHHLVPPLLVPVFVAVTSLGSLRLVLPGLAVLYWRWDADRAAFVASAVLGAFALTFLLKHAFALPRPPESLRLIDAGGYGFPSGHALDSTVTYGALASVARAGRRRQRVLLAGLVVGLVACSRVVLGVHYAVDVVAGIALGLGYLFVVIEVLDRRVSRGLTVAAALAAAGVVVTGARLDGLLLLGGILAALLAWSRRETDRPDRA